MLTLVGGPHAETWQTEAGCRMVIDALLLHTALNLGSTDYCVAMILEFRIDDVRDWNRPSTLTVVSSII